MIRYRTGDIFSIGPSENSFWFRGRLKHCLIEPESNQIVLFGNDLYDILDSTTLIGRDSHSLGVSGLQHSATGKPIITGKYKGSGTRLKASLELASQLDPIVFRSEFEFETERLTERIRATASMQLDISITWRYVREGASDSEYRKEGIVWRQE